MLASMNALVSRPLRRRFAPLSWDWGRARTTSTIPGVDVETTRWETSRAPSPVCRTAGWKIARLARGEWRERVRAPDATPSRTRTDRSAVLSVDRVAGVFARRGRLDSRRPVARSLDDHGRGGHAPSKIWLKLRRFRRPAWCRSTTATSVSFIDDRGDRPSRRNKGAHGLDRGRAAVRVHPSVRCLS